MVRRSGDPGLLGRRLAERRIRHLDLRQDDGRGATAQRACILRSVAARERIMAMDESARTRPVRLTMTSRQTRATCTASSSIRKGAALLLDAGRLAGRGSRSRRAARVSEEICVLAMRHGGPGTSLGATRGSGNGCVPESYRRAVGSRRMFGGKCDGPRFGRLAASGVRPRRWILRKPAR